VNTLSEASSRPLQSFNENYFIYGTGSFYFSLLIESNRSHVDDASSENVQGFNHSQPEEQDHRLQPARKSDEEMDG
jgi:hypothetical protein